MSNLLLVAKQVLILFILMGVGFSARKMRLLDDVSVKGIVNVLILFVTPCVIVEAFCRPFDATMMGELGLAFLAAVIGHAVVIAMAYALVRHGKDSTQRVLRLSATFSNAGFMGIPLEQAILGDRGVFFGVSYIVVFNLVIWSWGYAMMRGSGANDAAAKREMRRAMVVNPGSIGLTVGVIVFLLSRPLPDCIGVPLHFMAGMNTPLAMIVIGFYLAGARLGPVLKMPAAHLAATIRLVVYPLLMTGALYLFRRHLDPDMMLALVIASAAPVAAMVSMFAAKFDRDVDASVGLVSGTTILSIFTLPVVIALAMEILR